MAHIQEAQLDCVVGLAVVCLAAHPASWLHDRFKGFVPCSGGAPGLIAAHAAMGLQEGCKGQTLAWQECVLQPHDHGCMKSFNG